MAKNAVYITATSASGTTYSDWVGIDTVDTWEELSEAFIARLNASLDDLGLQHAELLVTDTEGALARAFSGSYGSFDLEGFVEARDASWAFGGDAHAAVAAFIENYGSWDEEAFSEAYEGCWESPEEFAEHLADSTGMLQEAPEPLQRYFDWQAWTRDLFLGDYWRDAASGAVFRSC